MKKDKNCLDLTSNECMAERVRKARRRRGYTKEYLAKRLGISLSYMAELENGQALLTVPILKKLCLVLGVSADYILFGCKFAKHTQFMPRKGSGRSGKAVIE